MVLFLSNCPQYLIAHFGIQKIGAIVCPSGPLNKEHELAYQVGDLKAVRIDEQLMKPGEKEIIEDLIVAAHADARRKAEALLADKMKSLTGGLPLPPGLKLF